jgi:hypothetical protein
MNLFKTLQVPEVQRAIGSGRLAFRAGLQLLADIVMRPYAESGHRRER